MYNYEDSNQVFSFGFTLSASHMRLNLDNFDMASEIEFWHNLDTYGT